MGDNGGKSRTPPPDGKTDEGRHLKTVSGRAGHHQPGWETNELLDREANELKTSREPDTTSWKERESF